MPLTIDAVCRYYRPGSSTYLCSIAESCRFEKRLQDGGVPSDLTLQRLLQIAWFPYTPDEDTQLSEIQGVSNCAHNQVIFYLAQKGYVVEDETPMKLSGVSHSLLLAEAVELAWRPVSQTKQRPNAKRGDLFFPMGKPFTETLVYTYKGWQKVYSPQKAQREVMPTRGWFGD